MSVYLAYIDNRKTTKLKKESDFMALMLDSFGMRDFIDWYEKDGKIEDIFNYFVSKGKRMDCYTPGCWYSHIDLGNPEVYSSLCDREDKKIEIIDMDMHLGGPITWKVKINHVPLRKVDQNNLVRMLCVSSAEGGESCAFVRLLNADILPSFLPGECIEVQPAAICKSIEFYSDIDEFADSFPEIEECKIEELKGTKLMPEMGTIIPYALYMDKDQDKNCEEDRSISIWDEDFSVITGTVKGAYGDYVKISDEERMGRLLRVDIDTKFGELTLVYNLDDISEEQRAKIKEGAIVTALAIISCDPVLDEYENGFVIDEKNNLKALSYSFVKGEAIRLTKILDDSATYESVNCEKKIIGRENIIEHIDYVCRHTKTDYHAYTTSMKGEYEGENCILLSDGEEDVINIVRVEMNENNLITHIWVEDINKYKDLINDMRG